MKTRNAVDRGIQLHKVLKKLGLKLKFDSDGDYVIDGYTFFTLPEAEAFAMGRASGKS